MSLTDGPNFHKNIKKVAAEEALLADGGDQDSGKFLFRKSGPDKAIISVIYKGKPTHHTVTISEDGVLVINKSVTEAKNLVELEDLLRTKHKYWPVPLTTAIPPGGGGGGGGGGASTAAPAPAAAAAAAPAASGGTTLDSAFYHKSCTKDKAHELLAADDGFAESGKYLFRKKAKVENAFILSIVYKGTATHHALNRETDGAEFTLNKNPTGCSKLSEVEQKYASKQPKWPVPLKAGVPGAPGATKTSKPAAPAEPAAQAKSAAQDKPAAPARGGGGGGGGGGDGWDFLHGAITKAKAEELLLANGGKGKSGKFLFRPKKGAPNTHILSVIYKGAATHHNVVRAAPGGELSLNKIPTGTTTLADLHEYLKTKNPKWPVPLTEGVPSGGGGGGGGDNSGTAPAPAPALAAAVAASSPSDGNGWYFFEGLSKEGAEKLLLADGGAGISGKFLFGGKANKKILSVIYKGKPTHHGLAKAAGAKYTLNKNPTPCNNLEEVAAHFSQKRPKWPVPLTEGVKNPKRAGGSSGGGGDTGGGGSSTPKVEFIEVEEEIEVEVEVDVTDDEATAAAGGGGPEADTDFQFNHKKINKATADELLLADGGDGKSGKFLFRQKPKTANDFLLSVIYKGKPTHHTCKFEDGAFLLNSTLTKMKTLYDLAAWLDRKRPKWPVPLTEGVTRKGYTGGGGGGKVYKKVKKMVKKKVTKKVAKGTGGWTAPVRSDGAGPLGFDDWEDPNGPDKAAELARRVGPVGKVEKRSWISKTWRRKKLSSLEDKPNAFGAWGNLISDAQASRMKSSGGGGSMPFAGGRSKRPSLFQNDVDTTFNIGLSKAGQGRMSSSFMSIENKSVGPSAGIFPDAPNGAAQECTFLGNCTCPDCL